MNVSERVNPTRRERDAVVALVIVLLIPLLAGFLAGLSGASIASGDAYTATVTLLLWVVIIYLGYRIARRAGRWLQTAL